MSTNAGDVTLCAAGRRRTFMLSDRGFDLWANGYDGDVQLSDETDTYPFAGYRRVLGDIYARVREGGARRVLDVGIGTATLSKRLYDDGIEVTGIDFSSEMLAIARRKLPDARLIQHDFSQGLPNEIAGEKFDFIICTYAIHHLTDAQKPGFIRELLSCLKPGGELLLGDVAFATAAERDACRADTGDAWDSDEEYIVVEQLAQAFPGIRFIRESYCSGVCVLGA